MAELLKEAIADAKAVREVALQNAKMALEEAFDSKIKNMLSARLAEELDEDVELEEEYVEEEVDTTDEAVEATDEGATYEEDSANVSDVSGATEEGVDEEINLDELMAELEEMSYEEDGEKSEGMKYDEDEKANEGKKDDEQMEEAVDEGIADAAKKLGSNLKDMAKYAADTKIGVDKDELMAIIKADGDATTDVGKLLQKLAAVGFVSKSTGKGKSFGAGDALARDGKKAFEEGKNDEETNESIDIDALISEIEADLEEGKKKEDKEDVKKEVKKAKDELKEALDTVDSLKSTISEMNLLNSKLLYCNKLFRANSLTEAQKVKVVDALDLATTANEAKLVFNTLQESFDFTGVEKRAIKEGLGRASKASGTAPKKVITESVDGTISRFQKLANIKF